MSRISERLNGWTRSARFPLWALLLCMGMLGSPAARAFTPAEQDEVQHFTLTEDFLQRYAAASQEVHAQGHSAQPVQTPKKTSAGASTIDTLTASVEQSPGEMAILQRHGLTARQAVLGSIVLGSARLQDMRSANPEIAKRMGASKDVSPANMAFYQSHKEAIHQMLAVKPH
ncbi:hypothetical protein [Paraburkholderia sp.]|uniref:hypothetical protein n=1 Tax=Paraburkholderia sp. TaxID=1926495 RepID=UPI003D6EFA56